MSGPKVIVSYPVYEAMKPRPLLANFMLQRRLMKDEMLGKYSTKTIVHGPRSPIRKIRNITAQIAIDSGADAFLFIDDDMMPAEDILERLLEAEKEIVAPLFHVWNANSPPCVFKKNGDGKPEQWFDHPQNELFECDAVGSGVLLVQTSVLKKMPEPWFFFDKMEHSMDVNFCKAAQEVGISIWCDSRLPVHQLGENLIVI